MWINFAGVKVHQEAPGASQNWGGGKGLDIEPFWDSPVFSPGLVAITSSSWTCWVQTLSDSTAEQLTQQVTQFTETVWPSVGHTWSSHLENMQQEVESGFNSQN